MFLGSSCSRCVILPNAFSLPQPRGNRHSTNPRCNAVVQTLESRTPGRCWLQGVRPRLLQMYATVSHHNKIDEGLNSENLSSHTVLQPFRRCPWLSLCHHSRLSG